ncbi:unnamed protein product [Paramecium pentaurelia]|uniref:cAMP-dependent protein kinase regulatory subunit n=1 Tax=Paramecium pentaurelia TaxID=43138 RepID=A0A8S1XQ32_9CILI|nr:unnamed protein product [Paramecium pentaurelia]
MQNQDQEYLLNHVNPILEQLALYLVKEKPDNVTQASIEWLSVTGAQIENGLHHNQHFHNDTVESSDDTESDEDDYELYANNPIRPDRASVSAEVYGIYNKKTNFKPKIVAKSHLQIQKIKEKLAQSFMFSELDEHDLRIVINAMEVIQCKKGDIIIKQGDDGDNLYIVDEGTLDCSRLKAGQDSIHLKTYKPGESFGELALLYNSPRAATIVAEENCVLFSLDRGTFNHIVKDAAIRKRERYEYFLAHVELLQELDPYSRSQIADALKSKNFNIGDYIVKEGDEGDIFYFLEKGEAVATKVLNQSQPAQVVYFYKEGDYFGEIALLRQAPRAASVIAETPCTVVYLDRDTFKRLLGPLEDILTRNFKKYEKYMN